MTSPDGHLQNWRQRRDARLRSVPGLRSVATTGAGRAWYRADELLVAAEHREMTEREVRGLGHRQDEIVADELAPGLIRLRAAGLDVPGALAAVRAATGTGSRGARPAAVGPNHVFLGAPFYQGGPFGPPAPASEPDGGLDPGQCDPGTPTPVAVLDGALWVDTPLPSGWYLADADDCVDGSGVEPGEMLDGTVGHANFVTGVVLQHVSGARVRIVRVLDEFGLCTEAELAVALAGLSDETVVVNASLGGYTIDGGPPIGLAAALAGALTGRDRLLVAAAGNDGDRVNPFWPAAFAGTGDSWSQQVVAVAAHDGTGLCDWSNAGEWITLAAPGQGVVSTFVQHGDFASGWASWSGTSFAAPRVTGAVLAQLPALGSASAALDTVAKQAEEQRFDGYPGLP